MNTVLKIKIIEQFKTQFSFARAVRTQEQTISRVVCGRQTLSDAEKKTWAKTLGCTTGDIFNDEN